MAGLGADTLILTNAAGALDPQFDAGGLMCISDQINFTGVSPLSGPNHEAWGERFPDMSAIYDAGLRDLACRCALELGIRLERGVYIGVRGPQMGMSSVLEVIAARHMGLRVLGISCLTNKNLPDCMRPAPLEEVIAVAGRAGKDLGRLVEAVVTKL